MQYSYGKPYIYIYSYIFLYIPDISTTADNSITFYIPDGFFCNLYTNQYIQGQLYYLPGCFLMALPTC